MFSKAYSGRLSFNLLLTAAGLVYALIMLSLLLVRNRYFLNYSYNLMPFDTIKQYIVNFRHYNFDIVFKNLLGNIVLFIPIGIIAPLLNTKLFKWAPLILFTILLIFCVELAQMLLRVGAFDVDDIILNTLGAAIGLLFTKVAIAASRRLAGQ